jgi:hypothetical protein
MSFIGLVFILSAIIGLSKLFAQLFGIFDVNAPNKLARKIFFIIFIISFWGFFFYYGYKIENTPVFLQ